MNKSAPIVVHALPPVWGTPSPSPFVIKLLTWLRMAKVDYEFAPLKRPPRSKSKKMPYVELPNGELVDDSARIIARLSADRGIDLDRGLDDRARATARLLCVTFEAHLYFAGLYERFITPEGWARTKNDYFARVPAPLKSVAQLIAWRSSVKNLHGQGTGRLPRGEVAEGARADISAIATTLGDKPFFLGDEAHTIDATALGLLWAISSNPFTSAARGAVESHPNLTAFVARMRSTYWADFAG